MNAAIADAPVQLADISALYREFPVGRTGSGIEFINLMDTFTSYLCSANAGMLNKGNLLCFDYAMRNLPSAEPIVEIGSFCGLSTNLLGYYKQKHGVANSIFNCDDWAFRGAEEIGGVGHPTVSLADYRAFVRETYVRNVKMFSGDALPNTVGLKSDDFFAAWGRGEKVADVFGRTANLGGPISFAYIDGDHDYESARKDFENVDRFLRRGGFVLFDDSADGSHWPVCRVIEQVKRMDNYRVVVKNPNYLFRKD